MGDSLDKKSFSETRYTLQKNVAVRQETYKYPFNQRVLTYYDLSDLFDEVVEERGLLLNLLVQLSNARQVHLLLQEGAAASGKRPAATRYGLSRCDAM